jgi:HlyD family secretion protein
VSDNALFRKAALDKLASPERLDVLMQVTPPQGQIATWTIAGLLVAGLAWAIFGTSPERVAGQGLLLGEGGIQQIKATGDGTIRELNLVENQVVEADEVLGAIAAIGNQENVDAARSRFEQAQRDLDMTRSSEEAGMSDLRAERRRAEMRLQDAERRHARRLEQFKDGDISKRQLDETGREVEAVRSELTQIDGQIRARQSVIQQAVGRVEEARIEMQRIANTAKDTAQIRSTVRGRVVTVLLRAGDTARNGDVIAEVETSTGAKDPSLEIVAFVPVFTGRSISPGDPVQVTVAGIKREEHGFMKGVVRTVSEIPVTPDRVTEVMKEQSTKQASYEVHITAEADPATVSGYAWSNGEGPPQRVTSGTFATVDVQVGERAPISNFLPYLRRMFGG